jgi:uncharacterized protein (DUF2236 family)
VAWRINGERVSVLGWGRAILLQLAHPLVSAGVGAHSRFRGAPWSAATRFHATLRAMLALTFGSEAEARATVARIRGVHDRVHGRLGHRTPRRAPDTPYTAHDPVLLAWVNLTLLESMPLAYGRCVRPVGEHDLGSYARESRWGAELIGARRIDLPVSAAGVAVDMQRWLGSGDLEVTDEARRLARAVVFPALSWLAGPLATLHAATALGWLPPPLRDAYGFRWSGADAAALERWERRLQTWSRRAPPVARRWGAARRAERGSTAR